MATTLLGENTVHTVGDLPAVGTKAPDFTLTSGDFTDVSKTAGKRTILDIFPSIATGVCQTGVRKFNELAPSLDNTEVICRVSPRGRHRQYRNPRRRPAVRGDAVRLAPARDDARYPE